jgi:hypothetical protein
MVASGSLWRSAAPSATEPMAKSVGPGRGQPPGHGNQAMSVGIGLDDGNDVAAVAAQQRVVGDNGPDAHPGPQVVVGDGHGKPPA